MKISLNKIRFAHEHYGPEGLVADGLDALVKKIGAQLGEVEEVVDVSNRFDGVIIAKVTSCEDHPNADRLHVCKIDDGGRAQNVERDENGHAQVVCGAPNVREGLLVAWLPPGSTVPESRAKEPFVLETRELRGVKSNGMLASPRELTLGENHDGILEIDREVAPGTPFAEAYRTEGEAIIDIENKMFTHRPDCFGTIGVVREIAGIQHKAFKSPDWYTLHPEFAAAEELKLTVRNELPAQVPRFTAVAMSGIEIKPSPVWLQIYLSELGVRPINNVVDYTNFWMLETGQPLHAYDYDKVADLSDDGGATIVVRNPKPDEKLLLLNGKEIVPRAEAILIATDKQAIGLGGVMGGGDTEVDANTKNIILESATFDMYSIRRTSMTHGLFTDAVTRFNKGQSPLQNLAVLAKAVESLQKDAGGRVASALTDLNQLEDRAWVHPPVPVTAEFINARLGLKLSADEMKILLENVEFSVEVSDDTMTVTAPFWRTDIETREDVVEEVGRLYGFDKLPQELPHRSIKPVAKNQLMELKQSIRENLVKSGANEVLTYSFVHGNLLDKVGQDKTQAFKLGNALSPDLQYYRLSITPSLLEKVHPNIKSGYDAFALFEIGKTHHAGQADSAGLPTETDALALVYAVNDKAASGGAAYYTARRYLYELATSLGLSLEFLPASQLPDDMLFKPFAADRSALVRETVSGKILGIVGELTASTRRSLKLPSHTAGFEIDLQILLSQRASRPYVQLSKFPAVTQDITLQVADTVSYAALYSTLQQALITTANNGTNVTVEPRGIYQPEGGASRNITFRVSVVSYQKTLTDSEVSSLLGAAAEQCRGELSAQRV